MPIYEEGDVLRLQQLAPNLSPDLQLKAKEVAENYRKQQEELGAPMFPMLMRKQQEKDANFNSLFTDINSVSKVFPDAAPVIQSSFDPETLKKNIANHSFLAKYLGRSGNEVTESYSTLRDALAFKAWGMKNVDDHSFYARAQQQVKEDKDRNDSIIGARNQALNDAYLGNGSDFADRFSKWSTAAQKDGKFNDETVKEYHQTYRQIESVVAPYREHIDFAMNALAEHMGVKDNPQRYKQDLMPKGTLDFLLNMPAKTRNVVVNAMVLKAQEMGKEVGKSKEVTMSALGEPDLNGPIQQVGESFARTLEDAVSPGLMQESMIEKLRGLRRTRMPEGADPKQLVDHLARSYVDQVVLALPKGQGGLGNLGAPSMSLVEDGPKLLDRERDLTPSEIASVSKELDRQTVAIQLSRKLKDISRTLDPTPNVMASTLGSSAALIPISGVSLGLGAVAYTNMEYEKLRNEQPNLPIAQARTIAAISGAVQAPFDLLEGSLILGKNPFLKDIIKGATSSALIKRGIFRLSADGFIQNFAEAAQDGTTMVVQEVARELDVNIKGLRLGEGISSNFSFEEKLKEFKDERADVAIGMIPLILLGVGVGAASDFQQSKLVSIISDDKVKASGVSEEVVNRVRELRDSGDLEGAVTAFKDGFSTATPERTAQALREQRATLDESASADLHLEQLARRGEMPTFSDAEEGRVRVTEPEGRVTVHPNMESAREYVSTWMDQKDNPDIAEVANLGRAFESQGAPGLGINLTETTRVSSEARTTQQDIAEGLATPEQVSIGVRDAGARMGLSEAEADANLQMVFGRNIAEIRQNIANSASTVYRGGNVLDMVREVVGGRWKAAVALGTRTTEQGLAFIRNVEQATGMSFLKGDTAEHITEAIGHIAALDMLGDRKAEGGVAPGAITRGLGALLQRIGNNTPEGKNVSKSRHVLDTFRKFFKSVFQSARALKKAEAEGKLGEGHRPFLDALLGVDAETAHMNAVADQARQMIEEVQPNLNRKQRRAKQFGNEEFTKQKTLFQVGDQILEGEVIGKRNGVFTVRDTDGKKHQVEAKDMVTESTTYSIGSREMVDIVTNLVDSNAIGSTEQVALWSRASKRIAESQIAHYDSNAFQGDVTQRELTHKIKVAQAEEEYNAQAEELRQKALVDIDATRIDTEVNEEDQLRDARLVDGNKRTEVEREYLSAVNAAEDLIADLPPSESLVKAHTARLERLRKKRADKFTRLDKLLAVRENTIKLLAKGDKEGAIQSIRSARDLELADAKHDFELRKQELDNEKKNLALLDKARESAHNKDQATSKAKLDQLAAARLYDAIYLTLPREDRAALGPITPLVRAGSNEARIKLLRERSAALVKVIEKRLKQEFTDRVKKIMGKAVSNIDVSGVAPKGSTDADTHTIFRVAQDAMGMTQAEVETLLQGYDAIINDPNTSPSDAIQKNMEREYAEMVGAWGDRTAQEMEYAFNELNELYTGKRKEAIARRDAEVARLKAYNDAWADQMDAQPKTQEFLKAISKGMSFDDFFTFMGGDVKLVHDVVNRQRSSDFALQAHMRGVGQRMTALYEQLATPQSNWRYLGMMETPAQAGLRLQAELSQHDNINFPDQHIPVLNEGEVAVAQAQFKADREEIGKKYKETKAQRQIESKAALDKVQQDLDTEVAKVKTSKLDAASIRTRVGFLQSEADARKALIRADDKVAFDKFRSDYEAELANAKQTMTDTVDAMKASAPIQVIKTEKKLTQMQAMQFLLTWQQEDGRRHMEGHGYLRDPKSNTNWRYDQRWVDELAAQLHPNTKEILDFLVKEYADLYPAMNAAYRERYGVNLPNIPLYSTLVLQAGKSGPEVVVPGTGQSMSGKAVFDMSWAKTRSATAIAQPKIADAMSVMLGHQREVAHWLHFYDLAKDLKAAFGHKAADERVKAIGGEDAKKFKDNWLQIIFAGGLESRKTDWFVRLIGRLVSNKAAAAILGRPITLAIQSTQAVAAKFHMSHEEYFKRNAQLLSGEISLKDAWNSRFIQNKIASLTPIEQAQFKDIESATDPNILTRFQDWCGKALNRSDTWATTVTYALLHSHNVDTLRRLNPGMAETEIQRQAHLEAERLTERTSQPIRAAQKSMFELEHNDPAWRAIWPFASESHQKLMFMLIAQSKWKSDPRRAARAVETYVAMSVMGAVVKLLWREARGDDDPKKWEWQNILQASVLQGLASGVPGLSFVVDDGGSLFGSQKRFLRALGHFVDDEDHDAVQSAKDVEVILDYVSFINPAASAIDSMSHSAVDAVRVADNLLNHE